MCLHRINNILVPSIKANRRRMKYCQSFGNLVKKKVLTLLFNGALLFWGLGYEASVVEVFFFAIDYNWRLNF